MTGLQLVCEIFSEHATGCSSVWLWVFCQSSNWTLKHYSNGYQEGDGNAHCICNKLTIDEISPDEDNKLAREALCHDHDLLQPSPHIPGPTSSLSKSYTHSQLQNTCSWSCLITPNPIGLNLTACTYLLLVLVPCLLLPHICYPTSTSFPLSVSLSSLSPSTLYHLTFNCLPSYPCYILRSSPYIQSPIHNLSQYVLSLLVV